MNPDICVVFSFNFTPCVSTLSGPLFAQGPLCVERRRPAPSQPPPFPWAAGRPHPRARRRENPGRRPGDERGIARETGGHGRVGEWADTALHPLLRSCGSPGSSSALGAPPPPAYSQPPALVIRPFTGYCVIKNTLPYQEPIRAAEAPPTADVACGSAVISGGEGMRGGRERGGGEKRQPEGGRWGEGLFWGGRGPRLVGNAAALRAGENYPACPPASAVMERENSLTRNRSEHTDQMSAAAKRLVVTPARAESQPHHNLEEHEIRTLQHPPRVYKHTPTRS